MPRSPLHVSPALARRTQQEEQALALRIAGYDYCEIARRIGLGSHAGALRAVRRALDRTDARLASNAHELRRIELARMEHLLHRIQPADTDSPVDLGVANTIIRLSERISKLLGLDAPQRTELTGAGGGPVVVTDLGSLSEEELSAYERLCERVSARAGPPGEAKTTA